MEESASKRRRTSPRLSAAPSSRDATPQEEGLRRDQLLKSRPKRPSYASPTRSSLSRHNPGILDRRRSSSPAKASTFARPNDIPASQSAREDSLRQGSEAAPDSSQSASAARGGLALPPRRSSARFKPRPLPPPAPEDDTEFRIELPSTMLEGSTGRQSQEPELPPVTSDPVLSTPPKGIHSSPSRWRERSRHKKSSPLKPPPARSDKHTEPRTTAFRDAPGQREEVPQARTGARRDTSTSAVRNAAEFDPNSGKKKERDTLLQEIAKLKRDLETIRKENEVIRFMQTSGRVIAPADENAVRSLVKEHLMPHNDNTQPSQQLLKVALDPKSFLSFGKQKSQLTVPTEEDNWNKIKSHHPVLMTAEEEAPYLELFSPFTISSTIAMLPSEPGEAVKQQYSIKIRSKSPPGLFNARVDMTVNATDLSILELAVPALEPAARFELRPFIDKICSNDCNRSMQRNVGLISWAMGEWYRVATNRALLWAHLSRALSVKEDLVNLTKKLRLRKSQRSRGEEEEEAVAEEPTSCTRVELLRFMGQQVFDVEIPLDADQVGGSSSPTIRLEWRIGFDWTGEARNNISAKIGVPGKWHHEDQRGALGKVPKLFEELVEGGEEPTVAAQTIVALLVGENM